MSRSSIFSFETLRLQRPYVGAGLVTALLLLAGAEVGMRAAGSRLGQPRLWGEGETSSKAAVFERYVRERGGVDLLILGPSHASAGIDAAALADCLTDPGGAAPRAFNAGLMGRDYDVSAFMLRHEWLRLAKPRGVLITVSPICFNAMENPLRHNTEEFLLSPMPQTQQGRWLRRGWLRLLVKHSYLYRMRWREVGLDQGFSDGRRLIDAAGWHALHGAFDADERSKLLAAGHPYREVWRDYIFGGESLESLADMVADAKAAGAAVALLEMPFREALFELPHDGRTAYSEYRRRMGEWARSRGVPWLDMQSNLLLSDADFKDADHLNAAGAQRLSCAVGEVLRRMNWSVAGPASAPEKEQPSGQTQAPF